MHTYFEAEVNLKYKESKVLVLNDREVHRGADLQQHTCTPLMALDNKVERIQQIFTITRLVTVAPFVSSEKQQNSIEMFAAGKNL
jgi:hypothetical protein